MHIAEPLIDENGQGLSDKNGIYDPKVLAPIKGFMNELPIHKVQFTSTYLIRNTRPVLVRKPCQSRHLSV